MKLLIQENVIVNYRHNFGLYDIEYISTNDGLKYNINETMVFNSNYDNPEKISSTKYLEHPSIESIVNYCMNVLDRLYYIKNKTKYDIFNRLIKFSYLPHYMVLSHNIEDRVLIEEFKRLYPQIENIDKYEIFEALINTKYNPYKEHLYAMVYINDENIRCNVDKKTDAINNFKKRIDSFISMNH